MIEHRDKILQLQIVYHSFKVFFCTTVILDNSMQSWNRRTEQKLARCFPHKPENAQGAYPYLGNRKSRGLQGLSQCACFQCVNACWLEQFKQKTKLLVARKPIIFFLGVRCLQRDFQCVLNSVENAYGAKTNMSLDFKRLTVW